RGYCNVHRDTLSLIGRCGITVLKIILWVVLAASHSSTAATDAAIGSKGVVKLRERRIIISKNISILINKGEVTRYTGTGSIDINNNIICISHGNIYCRIPKNIGPVSAVGLCSSTGKHRSPGVWKTVP